MSQVSDEYERLRVENSRIRVAEELVNVGVITASAVITGLIYHNSIKDVPLHLPTEEEIIDVMINGIEYGFVSPFGGPSGGSTNYKPETKEEALEILIQREKDARLGGYMISFVPVALISYLRLFDINPGKKVLKSSYAVGKTIRNNFDIMKSYLTGIHELKRKRKEVISYER